MNSTRFYPTRTHVDNPENLTRMLRLLYERVYSVEDSATKANQGVMVNQQKLDAAKSDRDSLLSGIQQSPAALAQLGVDQIATKLSNLTSDTTPTVNDDSTLGYSPGSLWIDKTGSNAYISITSDPGAAVWKLLT